MADQDRETLIVPYRDGPLLVRGPFRIQDQDGGEITVEREVVALCRCGKSRQKPLCDGSHKLIPFRAPSGPANLPPVVGDYRPSGSGNGSNGHRE